METQKPVTFIPVDGNLFIPVDGNLLLQQVAPVCWMCPHQRRLAAGEWKYSIIFGECPTWISDVPCEWAMSNPETYKKALSHVAEACNKALKRREIGVG